MAQAQAELIARYGGLSEYELDVTAAMLDPPSGAYVVARDHDGAAVGGVGVRAVAAHPGAGEVKRLWVDPAWRGHGVGRALMAGLEAVAGDLGQTSLYLATGDRQPEAVALYEATGWVRLEEDWDGTPLPPWHLRFHKPVLERP
jgi:GNAT superfamily N-acetyltransferase